MLNASGRFLRLCYRTKPKTLKFSTAIQSDNIKNKSKNKNIEERNKLLDETIDLHGDKIVFNTFIDHEKLRSDYMRKQILDSKLEKLAEARDLERRRLNPIPVSLKYFVSEERLLNNNTHENYQDKEVYDTVFQLPYTAKSIHETIENANTSMNKENTKDDLCKTTKKSGEFSSSTPINKWMTNYDHFDDTILEKQSVSYDAEKILKTPLTTQEKAIIKHSYAEDSEDEYDIPEWSKMYGTPDPNTKISMVPCGGCGALLHCTDTSIPGYIPSEIFKKRTANELRSIECQRCHFLKEYNIALDVNVAPEEYAGLLSIIEHKMALVILMVDLLDFPCSIWPGIIDIIGTRRPIIVVGNKVDLIPQDSRGYLDHIKRCLEDEIHASSLGRANIKDVSLISAKTGYGVEQLISKLYKIWEYKGDVFLVGCANVGKSSLFNALLQSDYCKVQAVDLVQRATISRWPGTTMNLLKFPIQKPLGWKMYIRNQRLKAETKTLKEESELRKHQSEGKNLNYATLVGHIGRTFKNEEEEEQQKDLFSYQGTASKVSGPKVGINEKDEIFSKSKWFYDTPGVMQPDQILPLLTTEELLLTLPKQLIRPRTYYLFKGSTIFIGGLARLDYLECTYPLRFTIFSSDELPITVTKTEDADDVYEKFLGTDVLAVPTGNDERLANWPGLKKLPVTIELKGNGAKFCCGDVVLSSAGWISVSVPHGLTCKLAAWTPDARGIHVRTPALLRRAVQMKGKRVRDTPAYRYGELYSDKKIN